MKGMRARSFLPRTAVLETTYACNHRCIYCSCPWERTDGSFDRRPEMGTGEWKELVSELCESGVTSLAFTGGESLLRDDLFDILRHASACTAEHIETVDGELRVEHRPPELYLLSNGRLIDRRILEKCRNLGIRLSLSLPGLDTYEAHTGLDGADRVLEGFRGAKALGIPVTANITVTKLNLHELERTMAAAVIAGAGQVLLNRFLPGGRGLANRGRLEMSAAEVREMLSIADRVLGAGGRPGSLGTETPFCVADPADYPHIKIGTHCSAAIHFFAIDPSGWVRVCNHSETRLAHWREWRRLKDDEYWKTFAFRRHGPAACSGCRYRPSCDAGCREAAHITTGSLAAPDPVMPPAGCAFARSAAARGALTEMESRTV